MGLENSRYMDCSRTTVRKVLVPGLCCLICNDHLLNGSHGVRYWAIWRKITGMDGLSRWLSGKVSACQAGDAVSIPESGRSPGGGHGMATHSGILGQRSLGCYSPWSHKELNVTQQLYNNNSQEWILLRVPERREHQGTETHNAIIIQQ